MPCLTLFASRTKRDAPLRAPNNEFELALAIRQSNIDLINLQSNKLRNNIWEMTRDLNSLWNSCKGHIEPDLCEQSQDGEIHVGPDDNSVKVFAQLSKILRNVRANVVILDSLSIEIAKLEVLALSNNSMSNTRKAWCEEQMAQLLPKFTQDVYDFKRYYDQLEACNYGKTRFKVKDRSEINQKYSNLYAALRAADVEANVETILPAAELVTEKASSQNLTMN